MTPLPVREGSGFHSPSMAETKTHLDTTPRKLWVLLLELGDELIIVHLQQIRANYGAEALSRLKQDSGFTEQGPVQLCPQDTHEDRRPRLSSRQAE